MSDDLIERLKQYKSWNEGHGDYTEMHQICEEAAAELASLRAHAEAMAGAAEGAIREIAYRYDDHDHCMPLAEALAAYRNDYPGRG